MNPWSFFLKLQHAGRDYYLVWSTSTDAPVTNGMSYAEFQTYYRQTYGEDAMEYFEARMELMGKTGCSRPGLTVDEAIADNRAGTNETHLSREVLIHHYCISPRRK